MKQLLVISEAKARREQKCLPIHFSVIMQRNGLILSSDPSRQDRTLGLVTDLQENCTQPLCVWWQPCAGPSSGRSQGWRLLQKVCSDCPDAPGTSAGGRTPQDHVQLKHKCPKHMSRWEQAMHVCKYTCTQQTDMCKNVTKKSRGLGLLKASATCSKLHPESQIHNTTRRLTSKTSSYDFSLACSEGFGGKVFLLCLLFHASELTSPCLHVPSWERSERLSAVPVC